MSTYSTSLGLEEITPGDQAGLWGNTTNTNLSLIDQAIAGVTPVSLGSASGSTYVLTYYNGAVDESRSAVIKVTGTATGPNIIQIPAVQKLYVFRNSSGNTITVQTAAAANTVTLKDGEATLVFCDGANAYSGIATAGVGTVTVPYGGTGATSFGAGFIISPGGTGNLVSVPYIPLDASSAAVSGVLPVANGGTGQSTLASGAILTGNGTGNVTSLVGGTTGYVPTWNGSAWVSAAPSSAIYPGAGIAVSTGSSWTTSYSSGNPIPISLGGTGATSLAGASIAVLSNTGTQTFAGSINAQAFAAQGAGSIGDQKFTVAYTSGGTTYNAGLSPTALQLGTSGTGIVYDTATKGVGFLNGGGSNIIITPTSGTVGLINNTMYTTGVDAYKGGSSTAWIATSDVRLKKNIQDYTKGLDLLKQINPRTWIYNGKGGSAEGAEGLGVVADEIEQVLPSVIRTVPGKLNPEDTEKTNIKHVDTTEITWLLVNAVKELSAKVDAQAAEITALQAKVGA